MLWSSLRILRQDPSQPGYRKIVSEARHFTFLPTSLIVRRRKSFKRSVVKHDYYKTVFLSMVILYCFFAMDLL